MRVAAVDLGTNTTRLLVADVVDGRLETIVRREAITRMGESVDRRRILLPTSIARVRDVLSGFRQEADRLHAEHVLAVGTSAVRDASNGGAFLDGIEGSYGFTARMLTGDEEAALTFRGVASDRPLDAGTLVVDIGGGSTELVLAAASGIGRAISTAAGSVRLTERVLHTDPPTASELEACAALVRSLLPPFDPTGAVGVAGTVVTAATMALGESTSVNRHLLRVDAIRRVLDEAAAVPVADRASLPGLEPARAPVIVAGLVVLREILARYGLTAIEVSERDLLDGAALAAAELPEPVSPRR